VPACPAHELLHEDQLVCAWIFDIVTAFAGIAGPLCEELDPAVEVDDDDVELEFDSCGAPPHPAKSSVSTQRPRPSSRNIRPP